MTGPEHFRRAEELATEAHKLLDQADGQITAGVWAAVVQTHAVLALAAATVLKVIGSAGTGKTWLALEHARLLAAAARTDGRRHHPRSRSRRMVSPRGSSCRAGSMPPQGCSR
jgi:predicted ribonuclease YlaK